VTVFLLAVLVVFDGALCGFRAAAGRNPRIYLGRYYRQSMIRGALWSLAVIAFFLVAGLACRAAGGAAVWASLLDAAGRMVRVYTLFAVVTAAALALYLVGHFDLGVLASVLVLGPLTLVRPVVILAGAAWAAARTNTITAAIMSIAAATLMIAFERLLALGRPPWHESGAGRSKD
jgi:hypothetical protein